MSKHAVIETPINSGDLVVTSFEDVDEARRYIEDTDNKCILVYAESCCPLSCTELIIEDHT